MAGTVRILLSNYRYFVSSGPERYLFNLTERLEGLGHHVVPFSVRYAQNRPTGYADYFVSPIGGEDEVYFADHRRTITNAAKGLARLFHSGEVERAVGRLIDDTRPDVAYVLCYLRKMSPSLLTGIKRRGVPLVVRISDYGMLCGEHHMLRDDRVCTACVDRGRLSQVRYRCIKDSFTLSVIDALATSFHHVRRYFDLVDCFVATNAFMADMLVRGGIPPDRIACIPTFTDLGAFQPASGTVAPTTLVYVGRLDRPKGVHIAVEAMRLVRAALGNRTPQLLIAGAGHDEAYVSSINAAIAALGLERDITLLGRVAPDRTAALYRNAYACLLPTLWFENLPNSAIEALASGCPVITSDLGSMSRTVTHEVDGLHVRPGDPADLAAAIERLVNDAELRNRLAEGAVITARRRHAPDAHITQLLDLFSDLTPTPRTSTTQLPEGAR